MRILFDQGTPVPLRRYLHPSSTDTATELGWGALENGDLIDAAEAAGYDLLVTTDRNLRYQQNLTGRRIGIVVLLQSSWPNLRLRAESVAKRIIDAVPNQYIEI